MPFEGRVSARTETFREGEVYVGLCPSLGVSSFGDTPAAARQSLQEALNAFVDECHAMGTLEEVLEEAGFGRDGDTWLTGEPVSVDLLRVGRAELPG
jgi:predicted RNase H-like HicB family nuclease